MDPRAIDPTECWVRHVRRRGDNLVTPSTVVGRVRFVRSDVDVGADGLNGRQGWHQAETTAVLSDDGTFSLAFPNGAGADGVLHRRRFAILTDPDYEPGEEWLEFWTDADLERPLFVGTPTDYEKGSGAVAIKGKDLTEVLAGSLSSDVDVWEGRAPADVLLHYARIPALARGTDDLEFTGGVWSTGFPGIPGDCWIVEVRGRWTTAPPAASSAASKVTLTVEGSGVATDVVMTFDAFDASVLLENGAAGAGDTPPTGRRTGLSLPGALSLRLVARYERVFAFVNGQLVAELRRDREIAAGSLAAPWPDVDSVEVEHGGTAYTLDAAHVEALVPFAAPHLFEAANAVPRALPGIPPATGLRARYYDATAVFAQNTTAKSRRERMFPLAGATAEPVAERLETIVRYPPSGGGAGYNLPANVPQRFAARWTGAVYLDLAAADRKLRMNTVGGNARLFVGHTLVEAVSSWASAAASGAVLTTGSMRDWLGTSEAGWFPIVVEQFADTGAVTPGMLLQDTALDGGGAVVSWAAIPQERLSPIGVYDDVVRNTPHRGVFGDIAAAFGYQWRTEPRSLESGEFPGRIEFGALVGRQTNIVIDEGFLGSAAQVSGSASDVVDGIVADAAGIAAPGGGGQLSAQVIDYDRAPDRLSLRQAYESLSEITEEPLLRTRIDSLIALRSSPNEQVGVRPRGQRDVVDTFPLTGDMARMDWAPGDGVRLELDSIDVRDQTPRQLASVAWPLRPDGPGAPTVGFRQRPRSAHHALLRLRAAIFGPRRTYQGGRAVMVGSIGGATDAGALYNAADPSSYAPLPANLDDVVRVVVAVQELTGTGWRLEVNGVDLGAVVGAVPTVGRFDITRAVTSAGGGAPLLRTRLIGGAAGHYVLAAEVVIRI